MTLYQPIEQSVRYDTMNSVLMNTVTKVFKEKLVRTETDKVLYLNIYDYAASQLQMFLMKSVESKRDLNSYIDLKEYLESFTMTSNLKLHPRLIKNYRKVFRWFILDVTFLRYKALIQNNEEHFIDYIPTIPNLMWDEDTSKHLRNQTLEFDFKEEALKAKSTDFNCLVISKETVDKFLDKISTGEISVIKFLSEVINERVPNIQEVVDFKEVAMILKQDSNERKRRAVATTVLYNYIYQIELHALIEYRREFTSDE